jgi:hypothetical protein
VDLNYLYSEHQLALMRAAGAISRVTRTRHLAAARVIADQIGQYQLSREAPAFARWLQAAGEPQ